MARRHATHDRAFTLVELLVVIGIIAILIGLLLPVLGGIAARGRDLQCQSNIRQCVNLALAYAAENDGRLPFGFYYARSAGGSGSTAPYLGWEHDPGFPDRGAITMWSVIANMSSKAYPIEEGLIGWPPVDNYDMSRPSPAFLRCPEASQVRTHRFSYVGSMTAFVSPYHYAAVGVGNPGEPNISRDGPGWTRLVERQTRLSQLLPFTALIWETAVRPRSYVLGLDIDNQRFWSGTVRPQYRYYSPHDPFGRVPPAAFGNERAVQLNVSTVTYKNIDVLDEPWPWWPYQGNLRFRHRKGTTCNVGFADGSVRQFTAKFKSDGAPLSHDALRKTFMVKWPSGFGIAPNPGLPH